MSTKWSGYVLGFAFGGFFDGILLHQVLQWHHLLSNVGGVDPRMQIAADGYFHVLMYLIAVAGLWLLWRSHRSTQGPDAFFPAFLIGFGVWNFVDIIGFHWLLQIHHIRMDEAPIAWDIGWLAVFGAIPVIVGLLLRRKALRLPSGRLAPCIAALAVIGAGAWAGAPSGPFRTALFAPDVTPAEAMAAVARAGGTIAWMDKTGQAVVFEATSETRPFGLYRHGAVLVTSAGMPPGCFDWLKV